MRKTNAVDFPPLEEPAPPAPSASPRPTPRHFVGRAAAVIGGLAVVMGSVGWLINTRSSAVEPLVAPPFSVSALASPPAPPPTPLAVRAVAPPNVGCAGSATFCTALESGAPAETLRKLAVVLPASTAKRYAIRVSITPVTD